MTERRGSKVKLKRQIFHGKLDNPTILPICIFYLSDLYYCISIIQLGSNAQKLDVYFGCPSWSSCGADHNPSYGVEIIAIRWAWGIMWTNCFRDAASFKISHLKMQGELMLQIFVLICLAIMLKLTLVIHNEAKSSNCKIWELG